jgi:hypothetical protein
MHYHDPADREHVREGVLKAGLPDQERIPIRVIAAPALAPCARRHPAWLGREGTDSIAPEFPLRRAR